MKQIFLILILLMVCDTSYANIASKEYVDTIVATIQVQDIQINGTSIVDNNIANIPTCSVNRLGAVAIANQSGIEIHRMAAGHIQLTDAPDSGIENRAKKGVGSGYGAITPTNLDKAIMEGLGNNSLVWSDKYKASARNTIGAQETISDLATIRSGASAGATAVQPGSLATVATSGSYNDLNDKPTLVALVPERPDDCTGKKCILIYDDTESSTTGFKWELIKQTQ